MKKSIAVAASGLLAVGALSACGNSNGGGASSNSTGSGPMADVIAAQQKLMDSTGYATTVKLETTPDDMDKIFTLFAGSSSEDTLNETLARSVVKSLAGFSEKVQFKSPVALKDVKDPSTLELAMTMGLRDKNIDLVYTGGEAYAKADVKGLAEATGLGSATQVDAMATQAQAAWMQTFIRGSWIGFPKAAVDKFWSQVKSAQASASASASSTVSMQQMQDTAIKAFQDNATATYGSKDDRGQAVEVTMKVKPLIKQITNDMSKLQSATATSSAAADLDKSLSAIKDDATLKTSIWLKDGVMTHAETDLAQVKDMFDTSKVDITKINLDKLKALTFQAKLVQDISQDVNISKPEGATMLTDQDLAQLSQVGGRTTTGVSSTSSSY